MGKSSCPLSRSRILTHGLFLVLFTPAIIIAFTQAPDGRCYLKGGSSSTSFTVTERLPPGEVIGELEVGGDSGPNGDIVLTLQENRGDRPMVTIVHQTKRIVLNGKLDKENLIGPSQLQFKVKCEKKNSNDPAIIIPVRIVVQDANDNIPMFLNAPYVLQLSESMSPGMVISSEMIKAYDGDQPGPFSTIQYSIVNGTHADFLAFQSALAPTLVIKRQLDYETLPNFTVTIKAQDHGQPPLFNTTTLTIKVLDADDQNPRFLNQSYFAALPPTNNPGDVLHISPSPIEAVDQDRNINADIYYSFDAETADSSYFKMESRTGVVSLRSAIPSDMGFPITLVIRATQVDNDDRRDLTTLTISKNPVFNGLRFLSTQVSLRIPENLPVKSILLRLQTNRPFDKFLQFSLADDFDHQFGITQNGDLILKKPVDFETVEKLVLEIQVASGSMSDTIEVNVEVIDVNEHDPVFNRPNYQFRATSRNIEARQSIGRILVQDEDRDDDVSLKLVGSGGNAFHVDSDGNVFVKNESLLNVTVAHLVAIATDNGSPPRQSSVPVEIVVPEEVLMHAGSLGFESTHALVIIFGVCLGILFVVIVILAAHIAKRKHQMERVGQAPIFPNHQPLGKMASYMNSSFLHLKLNSNNGKSLPNDTRNNNALVSSSSSVSGRCSSHQNLQRTPRKGGGGGGGLENPIFLRSPPCSPKRLLDNGVVNKATTTTTSSQGSTSSTDDGECSSQGDTDEDVAAIKKKCVLSGVNYFCQKHRSNFSQPLNSSSSSHVERNRMDKDFEMEEDTLEVHQNANGFTNGNVGSKRSSLKIQTENHSAIPKRVKKLSWEDEQVFKQTSTVLDPNVSVAPFVCKHSRTSEHPDVKVYF